MNTKRKIIYWVVGLVVLAGITLAINAWAAIPSDFGLTEGNTISAAGSNDPDVYIVNDLGYKRLFLNPVIFGFYGHLGGFANVKLVTPATRDAFITSGLFRVDGSEKVYGLETTGEDTGMLHWVNTTGAQAVADDSNFFKKVFVINQNEFNWYAKGSDYTSVNQIPAYARGGIVVPVQTNVAVLAANNLVSQTIPADAKSVKMLSVDFKGNGAINKLVVRRMGFVAFSKYDSIYLYKDGKYLDVSSSKNNDTATFNNLNLTAPFRLDVVVDFKGVEAGSPAQIKLEGDYNGLPLTSNSLLFASVINGKFELNASVTPALDKVIDAQVGAKIADFTASVSNDQDVYLKHLELTMAGGIDISNPKLVIDSVNYSGTVSGDKLIFNPNLLMKKDRTKTLRVYGDISASSGDELKVYLEQSQDIVVEGVIYGFGVNIENLDGLTFANAKKVTVVVGNMGTLSSKTDSSLQQPAILFGTNKNDILKFELDANEEAIELSTLKLSVTNAEAFIKNAYLYDGSIKVAEVVPNGNVLEFDANSYKVSDKTTLVLKADILASPELTSYVSVPLVTEVKGYGVNSGKEITSTLGGTAKSVYIYKAIPKITRTDTITDDKAITSSSVPKKVLSFKVEAVGGDIELGASAFNFALTQTGLFAGADAVDATYKCPTGYEIYIGGTDCRQWQPTTYFPTVPGHYHYAEKVVNTPAIDAVPAKTALYTVEVDGDVVASGSFAGGDITLPLSFPENVEILSGDNKEFMVYVNFSNFNTTGEREFMLELKDATDKIQWFVEDQDDNDVLVLTKSVAKTLTQLPMQSADFYSYSD